MKSYFKYNGRYIWRPNKNNAKETNWKLGGLIAEKNKKL